MYRILRGCDVSAIHAKEPISKSVSPNPIKSQNGSYLMVRGDTRDDTSQPWEILYLKMYYPVDAPSVGGDVNIVKAGVQYIDHHIVR